MKSAQARQFRCPQLKSDGGNVSFQLLGRYPALIWKWTKGIAEAASPLPSTLLQLIVVLLALIFLRIGIRTRAIEARRLPKEFFVYVDSQLTGDSAKTFQKFRDLYETVEAAFATNKRIT